MREVGAMEDNVFDRSPSAWRIRCGDHWWESRKKKKKRKNNHLLVHSVYALSPVHTRATVTLVDVRGTDVVVVAVGTVTLEAVHLVDTGATVQTRRRLTFVDVTLTQTACRGKNHECGQKCISITVSSYFV